MCGTSWRAAGGLEALLRRELRAGVEAGGEAGPIYSAGLIGFAATLPFFVLPGVYVGPAAQVLGGVDLGWLVGLLVSGAVYAGLSRSIDPAREALAIGNS
jgi:nucleobase:cation symporter-1, NCS1 family